MRWGDGGSEIQANSKAISICSHSLHLIRQNVADVGILHTVAQSHAYAYGAAAYIEVASQLWRQIGTLDVAHSVAHLQLDIWRHAPPNGLMQFYAQISKQGHTYTILDIPTAITSSCTHKQIWICLIAGNGINRAAGKVPQLSTKFIFVANKAPEARLMKFRPHHSSFGRSA